MARRSMATPPNLGTGFLGQQTSRKLPEMNKSTIEFISGVRTAVLAAQTAWKEVCRPRSRTSRLAEAELCNPRQGAVERFNPRLVQSMFV